jgi:hypothetical protein
MSSNSNSSESNVPETSVQDTSVPKEIQRVYLEFLSDLSSLYPDNKSITDFQNVIKEDDMAALRHIIPSILPHMEEISRRDHSACIALGDSLILVPGFTFKSCWEGDNDVISQSSQDALWKYLHTFYYLTCSYPKLDDILQEFAPPHPSFKGIIRNLQNHAKISQQIIAGGMFNMPKDMPGGGELPKMPEGFPFGENSAIGQLAREIASEVDFSAFQDIKSPADLFRGMFGGAGGPSAEGAGGVGRLISTVGQKLTDRLGSGKINEANIFQEAQQMMGMMSPMMTQMMSSAFFPPGAGGGGNGKKGKGGGANPFDFMSMMMNPGMFQTGPQQQQQQQQQQQKQSSTKTETTVDGEKKKKKRNKKK